VFRNNCYSNIRGNERIFILQIKLISFYGFLMNYNVLGSEYLAYKRLRERIQYYDILMRVAISVCEKLESKETIYKRVRTDKEFKGQRNLEKEKTDIYHRPRSRQVRRKLSSISPCRVRKFK